MKKSLLTIIFTLACLMGWAQAVVVDITSPEFSFEGDNLVMTTGTANASIFYGIAELPDLIDETITTVQNSLIDLPDYYHNPIELKKNVVIKAITLAEEGGTTVQSDTTIYVYGYSVWQMLVTAMTRGNSVYAAADGNPNVETSLLDNLHWALEEGEMFYGMRGSAPHFEAEHFANMINNYCDEIEAIIGPVTTAEPYAALSENNTVLTFYYDDQKDARGGMSVGPFSSTLDVSWLENSELITSVVFDASFADCTTITSTAHWFTQCKNLTSITGISNLKTDNVTDMNSMFLECRNLTSLDVSNFNTANVTDMFQMFCFCESLMSLDVSGFNTENVTNMENMFYSCSGMYLLDLSGFNTAKVENFTNFFKDCSSLAAIFAGNANIPSEQYAKIGNPNLLVYVNNASVAPQSVQNVVINGIAPEIILMDGSDGYNNWFCPQSFTAEKISYTRTFSQQTKIGVSRGWETIALPFDVQSITLATKGAPSAISPFGNNSGNYHFWLRRLTQNGLQSVLEINANTPYIISMPNSSEYSSEYNLAGEVTFSAENAFVPETEETICEYGDYEMFPVFQYIGVNEDIYALNVGEERSGHPEGSIFERNYRAVRPFEAVTMHHNPSRFAPQFFSVEDLSGDDDTTGMMKLEDVTGKKGDVYYDLQGRRVLNPSNGVFIQNGKKVVVK